MINWSILYDREIWVDIIVPILAALLGGWITMWGVVHTIKFERKNAREQAMQAAKPWIFSLDPCEDYDYKNTGRIILQGDAPLEPNASLEFILRNTDNGIGIIEKFITKNNEYFPVLGRILDKNTAKEVIVTLNTHENLENMYFIIRDVYGNRYKYKAFMAFPSSKGNHIEEIGLMKKREK